MERCHFTSKAAGICRCTQRAPSGGRQLRTMLGLCDLAQLLEALQGFSRLTLGVLQPGTRERQEPEMSVHRTLESKAQTEGGFLFVAPWWPGLARCGSVVSSAVCALFQEYGQRAPMEQISTPSAGPTRRSSCPQAMTSAKCISSRTRAPSSG